MTKIGQKFDKDKPMVDLIDPEFIHSLARVLTMGAKKYGPYDWRHVKHAKERYLAALYRHILAYHSGEVQDKESGFSHLHHAAANLMFLAFFEKEPIPPMAEPAYPITPGQGGCDKDANPIQEHLLKHRGTNEY